VVYFHTITFPYLFPVHNKLGRKTIYFVVFISV